MKTNLYYFSGTGNSLATTNYLAEQLPNTKIFAITRSVLQDEIYCDADTIGIIFPVYCLDMPQVVKRFVKKLNAKESAYIFAIATINGKVGKALVNLNSVLQKNNLKLNAGFPLIMPGNAIVMTQYTQPKHEQLERIESAKKRLDEIIPLIIDKTETDLESQKGLLNWFSGLSGKIFLYHLLKDRHYRVTVECNGCGICEVICPKGNITMENNKPKWHRDCESCFGCIHWCPKEAIQSFGTKKQIRYHHPNITVKIMKEQNRKF